MIKKLFTLSLLVLAVTACGGSGSYDGSSHPNLVGTWVRTSNNYYTATNETFNIHRQTLIVTDEGNYLEFTDCITDESMIARIDNNVVEFFSAGEPVLTIVNGTTLRAALSKGATQTHIELKKISSDTTIVLAEASLAEPATVADWDQVCVETSLDQYQDDEMKLKLVSERSALTLAVNLMFDGDITATTYDFSTGSNYGEGSIAWPLLNANILNPAGTIDVIEDTSIDFSVDLEFENSTDNSLIPVVGTIEFDPTWFSYE